MHRFSTYIVLALLLACVQPTRGQQLSNIPGAFAEVGVGALMAGQGFTGTASITGARASNWNVAGIYPADGLEASFSYVDQLGILDYGHFALAVPLKLNRNAISVSGQYSGDESFSEQSVQLGYAHRLYFLWLGAGVSYRSASYGRNAVSASDYVVFDAGDVAEGLNRRVEGSATGFSVDIGLLMMLSDDVRWGVSVRNVSAPITWKSYSQARNGISSYIESIPLEWSTGVHYRLSDTISGSLEWVPGASGSSNSRMGLGVELKPVQEIALRAGRMIFQDGYKNEVSTFGFGLRTPPSMDVRLAVDYAFIASDVANTQQISLLVGL